MIRIKNQDEGGGTGRGFGRTDTPDSGEKIGRGFGPTTEE